MLGYAGALKELIPTLHILDSCPSSLLKVSQRKPVRLAWLCCASLTEGRIPKILKVVVKPLPNKKIPLDSMEMCNYRSLSNIPFGSKALRCVVVKQLQRFLEETDDLDAFQSVFRPGYEMKTALINHHRRVIRWGNCIPVDPPRSLSSF